MPKLSRLLNLIEKQPAYLDLLAGIKRGDAQAVVLDAARPCLVAALHTALGRPLLLVTARPEHARQLHEQLLSWCKGGPVWLFPEPDALPYERLTSDITTELERVQVLTDLGMDGEPPLLVASAPALLGKLPSRAEFSGAVHTVEVGMSVEPFRLLEKWLATGYRLESLVEVPGTVSHRGGIIDIYPPTVELPVRLEFFGNTVDSLRSFEPASQRSTDRLKTVTVGPATELLSPHTLDKAELKQMLDGLDLKACAEDVRRQFRREAEAMLAGQAPREVPFYAAMFNGDSLLDYLPPDALLVIDEPNGLEQAVTDFDEEAGLIRLEKEQRGELPPNFPQAYFNRAEITARLEAVTALRLEAWGDGARLEFGPAPGYAGQLPAFLQKTAELRQQGKRLVIVSHQASRLADLLEEQGVFAAPVEEITELPPAGALALVSGSLPEGWVMGGETCLFTDAEIFGFVKQRRLVKKRPAPRHKLMEEIAAGDYVVHVEHGIGKFLGVTTLDTAGGEREYLTLQYAAGDTLHVPTEQIDRVSRYVGAGERVPHLSRLGTQEWSRTRQKAKEAAEELAKEMLALYAAREVVPGYAFSRDTVWQQELEAAFPYVETPDQLQAQADVKADMERTRPMDRLVCGDVGYGKTEVAIRAAFKAVMDGRQVAVLVPTTVLAQQHYATFSERLGAFPLRVDVLSRFRTAAEQREIINSLAEGQVDICIGTHRLLQKDIAFKNLGLLIIDEEQRFGVAHKDYLRRLRQEVDVLTLSATPIPRTLHMSLVGVRDMSTMETPPEARLPVKTYVAEYSDRIVREAVLREMERNGQVFFVHNRVRSIGAVADNIRAQVPEARVAVGHGQMPEEDLERVMDDFGSGRVDVLVCTTIIESGLDMPNANTVIINHADRFGLTQLYQLRGRVGRGANLAYAYFLYDGGKYLTPVAHRRLRTIYEAADLGAGFTIAMKDLEIRGAGNLLGHKQSGHITAVGFNLYTRLLAEAVEERKARIAGQPAPPRLPAPAVDLPLDAYIPEDYVADVDTRLELYRELTAPDAADRLDELTRAYNDRFGTPPPPVENLFYAVRVKGLGARAAIASINTEDNFIAIRRFKGQPFDRVQLAPAHRSEVLVGKTRIMIDYKKLGRVWKRVLEEVLEGLI